MHENRRQKTLCLTPLSFFIYYKEQTVWVKILSCVTICSYSRNYLENTIMHRVPRTSLHCNNFRPKARPSVLLALFSIFFLSATTDLMALHPPLTGQTEIKIGVLAKRGEAKALQQWGPTAAYLNEMLPHIHFQIVPLDFNAIYPAAENKEIDFILTNSAFYIGLVFNHQAQRILTLKNKRLDQETTRFGGVIFTRADNQDINTLKDLRHKRFKAIETRSNTEHSLNLLYRDKKSPSPTLPLT